MFGLPFNRKERYWTSCVAPQILCAGQNFEELHKFLELLEVKAEFVKKAYSKEDLRFETEYCLKDAAKGDEWGEGITGETPDILILLKNNNDLFLIFLEAKMYNPVNKKSIREQLNGQKKIAKIIMNNLNISEENFLHVVVTLKQINNFKLLKNEKYINWNAICNVYASQKGTYFYDMLVEACRREELVGKQKIVNGKYNDGYMTYIEILAYLKDKGDFYVGRGSGSKNIEKDCQNGDVITRRYEVNRTSEEPPNRNWVKASKFKQVLIRYGIIQG